MKRIKQMLVLMLCGVMTQVFASPQPEDQERSYLVQLVNQLDAMTPLVLAAEREQPQNVRMQFHYTAWRDSKGQLHNGLLEDIKTIKAGIRQKLDQTPVEPRALDAIRGDYLDKNNVSPESHS
ncbi:MAG TPA: RAQPRD family integrative conjugative element protein [Gammaproteobacteria bacterium]|nr:RAQPRD family integrative conjugative element protein [Gammaproteobacteria bacterium]HVY53941.1 RAQPRD family integrative conjugative element protein [Gammaproteobacteria bacterium]